MYRLQHEFDFEPSYIFGPDQDPETDDDDPVITVAPGNYALALSLLAFLNGEPQP